MAGPLDTSQSARQASKGVDTADEFAARFQESSRVLWLVAAGISGDRTLADDILQEAAVVALQKLDQYRPGTNFTAWMSSVVRYVALNQVRKENRRRSGSLDPAHLTSEASPNPVASHASGVDHRSATDGGYQALFSERIEQALQEVSEVARACLLLRTVENMEYSRVADVLGIPEGTAMSHVHRTRKFLRDRLADVVGPER